MPKSRGDGKWLIILALAIACLTVMQLTRRMKETEQLPPRLLLPGYDFIKEAELAKWGNDRVRIDFSGDMDDPAGFAGTVRLDLLEDRKIWPQYLALRPEKKSYGMIRGLYGPLKVSQRVKLALRPGFEFEVRQGEQMRFKVMFVGPGQHAIMLYNRPEIADGCIPRYIIDLEPLAGQTGYVIFQLEGDRLPTSSYAAWAEARIISSLDRFQPEKTC